MKSKFCKGCVLVDLYPKECLKDCPNISRAYKTNKEKVSLLVNYTLIMEALRRRK